uniref:Maturase K n=1 Tax=Helminthostachys zeylanica TaxID=41913 RepID=A0A1C6ZVW2_HELZY|nr:maturase K [Helminthostachys zeylanica]
MRTTSRISNRIDELQIGGSPISWQRRFSYPLPLHDDIYAIARNHFFEKSSLKSMDHPNLFKRYSLLAVKRSIRGIRRQTILSPILRNHDQDSFNIDWYLSESLAVVLEITPSIKPQPLPKDMSGWNGTRSIHSIPLFMEDKFLHSNHILDLKVPYYLHPEILIRLLRRRIRDAPFLHLLRLISHNRQNTVVSNIPSSSTSGGKNSLFIVLWNFYSHDFEDQLILLGKRFSKLRSIPYTPLVDQPHFFCERGRVIRFSRLLPSRNSPIRNSCIHYARYGNHCILASEGTILSTRKWIHYIMRLWQYNYHFWVQPRGIRLRKSSKHCSYFLGYALGLRSEMVEVKARMIDYSPITRLTFRVFCPIIPASPLTKSLAKEGFCDGSGRPISRSAWTTSTDDDITNRFNHVWRSLSLYYSGSFGVSGLYKIRYILRFSCAKTLACKHKSTIRAIWKRFGSRFILRSFPVKPSLTRSGEYSHRERFWRLDVIKTNPLIDSMQESYE